MLQVELQKNKNATFFVHTRGIFFSKKRIQLRSSFKKQMSKSRKFHSMGRDEIHNIYPNYSCCISNQTLGCYLSNECCLVFSKSINLTRYQALNVCKELLILRKMLIQGQIFFNLLDQFWSTAAMFLYSNILMTYQIKANNMQYPTSFLSKIQS